MKRNQAGLAFCATSLVALAALLGANAVSRADSSKKACTPGADGNVTGLNCGDQNAPGSAPAIQSVAKVSNYLKDHSSCAGLLSKPEELQFLKQTDSINAEYLEGKLSKAERGKALMDLVATTSKGKPNGDRLQSFLTGLSLEDANEIKKNFVAYAAVHGKVTPAMYAAAARMDMSKAEMDGAVKGEKAKYAPYVAALTQVGAKQSADGSWDYSRTKMTADQISRNPKLLSALGLLGGTAQAKALADPNRKDATFLGDQIFLPPMKDGTIQGYPASLYKSTLQSEMSKFQDAAKEFMSASKASTTFGNEMQQKFGGGSKEQAEKADALNAMEKALSHIEALGPPGEGNNSLVAQVQAVEKAAKDSDQKNVQDGAAKLQTAQKALEIATVGAVMGYGIGLIGKGGDAADLPSAVRVARQSLEAESAAKRASESVDGAGALVRLKAAAAYMSDATSGKEMLSMAGMPFAFSGVSSAITATTDWYANGTSWACSFANDYKDKLPGTLMMANFAFVAPAAALAGGVADVVTGGKAAASTVAGVLNVGQAGAFATQMAVNSASEVKNCAKSAMDFYNHADAQDAAVRNAQGAEIVKACANSAVDVGFAYTGVKSIKRQAVEAMAQDPGDLGQAVHNYIEQKQRANGGELRVGDSIIDKRGNELRVVDTGVNAQGNDAVALVDKKGKIYQVSPDQLKPSTKSVLSASRVLGGDKFNTKLVFGSDDAFMAKAQDRYNQLPGKPTLEAKAESEIQQIDSVVRSPASDVAGDVTGEEGPTVSEVAKTNPTVREMAKRDVSLLTMMTKDWKNKYKAAKADDLLIQRVVDDLDPKSLKVLDERLQKKPEEVAKLMSKVGDECMGGAATADAEDGSWDPSGDFKGILYAVNDAACWNF